MGIKMDEIGSPAGDAFNFENDGDTAKGVITGAEFVEMSNFEKTGKETKLVITLATEDGEAIKVFARTAPTSNIAIAIRQALEDAGADELEIGGTLAVQLTGREDIGKGSPMKVHVAAYEAPKAQAGAVAASDLLG